MNPITEPLFSHAYILGGSPCCGKSTIAEMLAVQFNLEYYKVDDHEQEHMERSRPDRPIILEGASYLPALIHGCGIVPDRVFFMAPTNEFQFHHYRQRPWIHGILNECSNPEKAFANWMERDQLFGQEILLQAEVLGYATELVDGGRSIDAQYERVAASFGLS